MCSRFSASFDSKELKIRWRVQSDPRLFTSRYNVAPGQDVPVIIRDEDKNQIKAMKWGLVPSWSSDPSVGSRMINARAETLTQKPSFKNLIGRQRCVIPANGFYEWRSDGRGKIPVWFYLKTKKPFGFAGLWDTWRDPENGDMSSFTIITTTPNALIRRFHNRMPVVFDTLAAQQWLDPLFSSQKGLRIALQPFPSALMAAHDVSTSVNSPENDSPDCVQPVRYEQNLRLPYL
jgi:putative SOS response-associated peptidase YedK